MTPVEWFFTALLFGIPALYAAAPRIRRHNLRAAIRSIAQRGPRRRGYSRDRGTP